MYSRSGKYVCVCLFVFIEEKENKKMHFADQVIVVCISVYM